jgi:mono/diheme cytochrome c family protein
MATQPAYRPLRPTPFFRDGQSARPQVFGTVARGELQTDSTRFEGKKPWNPKQAAGVIGALALEKLPIVLDAPFEEKMPMPLTVALLKRGQERFDIYCAVCHDRSGSGDGMIVQRGYAKPPSYHVERLRKAPDGYLFDVITRGHGAMPDYASQIPVDDRWAIVGYVRALQLAGNAKLADLSEEQRKKLEAEK